MSTKRYRLYLPRSPWDLPPSPMEWLPEGHVVYFILDLVDKFDLSAFDGPIQAKDHRGNRPYDPKMMVALLIYAWCCGIRSSRRIAQLCWVDVAFRIVTGNQQPEHSVISAFRRTHADALSQIFVQVVEIGRRLRLISLDHVAFDGTKVQAAASKHKAMSYERMAKRREQLKKEIDEILAEAEATDQEEDQRHGPDRVGNELPTELQRREKRLKTIEKAMAELEEEARRGRAQDLREQAERTKAKAADKEVEAPQRKAAATRARRAEEKANRLAAPPAPGEPPPFVTPEGLPMNRPPATVEGEPLPSAQRNFVDPDSRIMEKGGSYLQGFNCQTGVDSAHQMIVACGLTNQSPDNGNLVPMVKQVKATTGEVPRVGTADSGFWNPTVEEDCRELGMEAYVATKRERHGEQAVAEEKEGAPLEATAPELEAAAPVQEEGSLAAGEAACTSPEDVARSAEDSSFTGPFPLAGVPTEDRPFPPVPPPEEVESAREEAGSVSAPPQSPPTAGSPASGAGPPHGPEDARARMARRLQSPEGREIYRQRKYIVEPVYGQMKGARGLIRFLRRGLKKAAEDWTFECTCHNVLKLFRHRGSPALALLT